MIADCRGGSLFHRGAVVAGEQGFTTESTENHGGPRSRAVSAALRPRNDRRVGRGQRHAGPDRASLASVLVEAYSRASQSWFGLFLPTVAAPVVTTAVAWTSRTMTCSPSLLMLSGNIFRKNPKALRARRRSSCLRGPPWFSEFSVVKPGLLADDLTSRPSQASHRLPNTRHGPEVARS